jgi:peroxiredoxin
MKYLPLLLLITLAVVSCKQKETADFTVEGKISNAGAAMLYLEQAPLQSSPVIVDSAKLDADGRFKLSSANTEENLYLLRLTNEQGPIGYVVNDVPHITLDADLKNLDRGYTVKGSPASQSLIDFLKTSNKKLSSIYAQRVQLDSLRQAAFADSLLAPIVAKNNASAADFQNYITQFMQDSKSPSLTIFALGSYQSYSANPALGLKLFTESEVKNILEQTANRFPTHQGLAQLKNSVLAQQKQAPPAASALLNKPAPDFTLMGVDGKPVSLSSFRGKYVLVDFWASWCGPCRQENPNVVKAYQQFRDKNFTVLGISLDKNREDWIKAIQQDSLTWTHASDLQYWNSAVVPLYGIEGIPYNVLMDPKGLVIAENLKGVALKNTLAKFIGK